MKQSSYDRNEAAKLIPLLNAIAKEILDRGAAVNTLQARLDSIPDGLRASRETLELIADREYNLSLRAPLEVGVQDLEFVAYWHRDHSREDSTDLIITESVTNTGNSSVNLSAFVSAPGLSRQRRSIGGLEPGQTATRTFRLADGARLLPGRRVRIGIITQDGARLNRVLEIPD